MIARITAVITVLLGLFWWSTSGAQFNGCQTGFCNIKGAATSSYSGPGDVVNGAVAWWGLRAYNAAYAAGQHKIANVCTPADVSCADVNSDAGGNFNLAGSGLTCNNSTSICTIKTFYDQSGSLSCSGAACDVTQATIGIRATVVTSCIGSLVCASGIGTQIYGPPANFPSIAVQYTTSGVAQRQTGTGYQAISGDSTTNFGLYFFHSANVLAYFNSSPSATVAGNDNVWHACQGRALTASITISCDGTAASNAVAGVILATPVYVMTDGTGEGIQGLFAEVGWWPVGFSAGNITAMNSNQHTYWGF